MRVEQGAEQIATPVARPFAAHALHVHARAFQQQVNFVGELFGIAESRFSAQLRDMLPLTPLVALDDFAPRVVFFRNLHRGIGQRAAAIFRVGHASAKMIQPGFQLGARLTGMGPRHFVPD